MESVLVAGATGKTGKKVINLLKMSQYFEPVAMVRNKGQIEQFRKDGIKIILGDLEKDISHVLKNIDKVVFAAGSGGKKVIEVDQEGAKKLISHSEELRIKKFVMLSSMGADKPESVPELRDYLKAKKNADEFLRKSSILYTIVRPGRLTDEKGKGHVRLDENLNTKGTISRDDVAQTLVRTLHDDAANNETFELLEGDTLIGKALENIS